MEKFNRLCNASCCLVLVLLLLPTSYDVGMILMVEGRDCESQSHLFRGRCVSDTNCELVCHNEGFPGGKCNGMRGRCFCTKPC
ncbi:defensin Ec-AMP-D1-like [Andrographis paniculata]|uniref:defensin Ec-AMP-D1-like n=1 Tax=Andrographis paniculata TaxID=175694 RepID=UPI0021E7D6D4|nr:defensin Ec-AMP-D1-like [Andrographis paniculata]